MQEKYCANWVHRPGLNDGCGNVEGAPGRTFLCARCRKRVLICSRCDRGQLYCAEDCALIARRVAQRAAGRRYQQSRDGRFAHAERNRRYRVRQKNVTHQGSAPPPPDGQVTSDPTVIASEPFSPTRRREYSLQCSVEPWRCHFCGYLCPEFVRQGFLRRRRVPRRQARRGTDHHGHTP